MPWLIQQISLSYRQTDILYLLPSTYTTIILEPSKRKGKIRSGWSSSATVHITYASTGYSLCPTLTSAMSGIRVRVLQILSSIITNMIFINIVGADTLNFGTTPRSAARREHTCPNINTVIIFVSTCIRLVISQDLVYLFPNREFRADKK